MVVDDIIINNNNSDAMYRYFVPGTNVICFVSTVFRLLQLEQLDCGQSLVDFVEKHNLTRPIYNYPKL